MGLRNKISRTGGKCGHCAICRTHETVRRVAGQQARRKAGQSGQVPSALCSTRPPVSITKISAVEL